MKWVNPSTDKDSNIKKRANRRIIFFYFLFLFLFWLLLFGERDNNQKKNLSVFVLFPHIVRWSVVVLIARVWQCSFFEISCNVGNTVAECPYTNTIRYGRFTFQATSINIKVRRKWSGKKKPRKKPELGTNKTHQKKHCKKEAVWCTHTHTHKMEQKKIW